MMNTTETRAAIMSLATLALTAQTGCAVGLIALQGAQTKKAEQNYAAALEARDMTVAKEACSRGTYEQKFRLEKLEREEACELLRGELAAKSRAGDTDTLTVACAQGTYDGALRLSREERDAACGALAGLLSAKVAEGDCAYANTVWEAVGTKPFAGFEEVHFAVGERAVECKDWGLTFGRLTSSKLYPYDGPALMKHLRTRYADDAEFNQQWAYRNDVVHVIAAPADDPSEVSAIDELTRTAPATLCEQIDSWRSEDARYYMSLYLRWQFKASHMEDSREGRFRDVYEPNLLKIEEDYTFLNKSECESTVASFMYIKGLTSKQLHASVKDGRVEVTDAGVKACMGALGSTPRFANKAKKATTDKDFDKDYFTRHYDYHDAMEKHYASCFDLLVGKVKGGDKCKADFECKSREKICFSWSDDKPRTCVKG